jgi:hypothetical protein
MPWPSFVVEQFSSIDRTNGDEVIYYAPYRNLLNFAFPSSEQFQITPHFLGPLGHTSIDFNTFYLVRKRHCPVLFLHMKTAAALGRRKSRAEADCDIREQLIRLTSSQATPGWKDVPLLYGISTMGSQFRVYIHDRDTRTVTPSIMEVQDRQSQSQRRDSGSGSDSDAPPPSMWAHDLLNEEGEQVLMALIEEVKAMCSTAGLCASL